jgi:2-keto-4-pentenoate hydratase
VGRKIGLTSKTVQKQVGVDQPDFGMLYADMGYGSGDEVEYKTLIQPKVESEICLVLQRDLTFNRHNIQDIINATAYALPSIEIVDSRIKDWDIKIYDTIADNASSAMFVLGSRPVKLSKIDLEMCGMSLEVNGQLVSSGAGMACMGNPLNAAIWLADKCVEMGMPLRAGDIIMTGALGPFVNVRPGDSIRTKIEGLGEVNVHFTNENK